MKLLKKLSAKDICGPIVSIVKGMKVGEQIQLYGVAGICKGYETGMSTFGEWTRFTGDFEAVNYVTGEIARSPAVHVPDTLEHILVENLQKHEPVTVGERDSTKKYAFKDNVTIEFAFVVDVCRLEDDEKGGVNYKYITSPKTEVEKNDAISHLSKLLPPPKGKVK